MKTCFMAFVSAFILVSSNVFAQNFSMYGLNFGAPTINGRGYIASPNQGDIVFDTASPAGFFGYNGVAWIDMNAGVSAVPAGTISAYAGVTPPTGYVLCDGSSYSAAGYANLAAALWDSASSKYAYGGSGTYPSGSFNVPDLRGKFLRGVNGGSSSDPDAASRTTNNVGGNTGNNVGSQQSDQVGPHAHNVSLVPQPTGGGNGIPQAAASGSGGTGSTLSNGTSETRPKNVYVNFIIKI
ncbi:MAG: tail fiber protein [Bdellovibrionaceae bacterium]|nr:tail fiber protein [Pseudobdellovibrionaceae bacterium]